MRKVFFRIRKSKSKKEPFFWTLHSVNGQKYSHSENYVQKQSAKDSIKNIINAIKVGEVHIEDTTKV